MKSRPRRVARGLVTVLAAALTGVAALAAAPGAWAQVTITPTQSQQGGAVNLTFLVPDDRGTAYTTQVEVQMSPQAPVGEVYPLSVDTWAPTIKYREISEPVQGIHSSTTTIASSVTWTRVVTDPPKAGSVTKLTLAMGPLPLVQQLPFSVVQTYSDHTVRRWGTQASTAGSVGVADGAAPVLTLVPAAMSGSPPTEGGETAMSDMEGMPGMAAPAPADAPEPTVKPFDSDGPIRYLAIGLVVGIFVFGLVGGWIVRTRRSRIVDPSGE